MTNRNLFTSYGERRMSLFPVIHEQLLSSVAEPQSDLIYLQRSEYSCVGHE